MSRVGAWLAGVLIGVCVAASFLSPFGAVDANEVEPVNVVDVNVAEICDIGGMFDDPDGRAYDAYTLCALQLSER